MSRKFEKQILTHSGQVLGKEDEKDTLAWIGVPYAKAPCGELRWRAPQPPEPWPEVFDATHYGPLAPQVFLMGEQHETSEDCLSLNIWRPDNDTTELPVYVWIHGGGNFGSMPPVCDTPGARVAHYEQVVFVSFNYRLAEFGWFAHPALRTGDPAEDSGNFATLDMIKVLSWIQDNISAFGGDKNSVLISGESAGGVDVLSLMNSPLATGLFHKAVVQSGGQSYVTMEDAEEHANSILSNLLVTDKTVPNLDETKAHILQMTDPEIADYLRSKSYQEITAAKERSSYKFNIRDGIVIHKDGAQAFENGTYPNKVPTIIGTCSEEPKVGGFLMPQFQGKDEFYQSAMLFIGDTWKAYGCDSVARNLSKFQDNVWAYHFRWGALDEKGESAIGTDMGLKIGACHAMDIAFFFNLDDFVIKFLTAQVFTKENEKGRKALSHAMMTYMKNFSHNNDPNGDSEIPEWYQWSNEENAPKSLVLDADADTLKISMMAEEYTSEKVEASIADSPHKEGIDKMKKSFAKMGMSALNL